MIKATIHRKDLNIALARLQSIIPTRPSITILSNIRFSFEKNVLTLESTDLYLSIACTIPVSSNEDGSFTVLGKPFIDLCKTLTHATVELTLTKNELSIKSGSVQTLMMTQPTDDFPSLPKVIGKRVDFSTKQLETVQRLVLPSVSPDSARPLLTGILMRPGSPAQMVATDGFRLSVLDMPSLDLTWEKPVVVPAKFITELLKNSDGSKQNIAIIYSEDQKLVVAEIDSIKILSRTLDGEYPPYEKIIPVGSTSSLRVSASDLLEQVKRAVIFSRDSMNAVQIVASTSEVIVQAQSTALGQFAGTVTSAHFEGDDISIAFNSKYLIDYLQAIEDQEIVFSITDALKPVIITSANLPEWKYVVMPFKLNS